MNKLRISKDQFWVSPTEKTTILFQCPVNPKKMQKLLDEAWHAGYVQAETDINKRAQKLMDKFGI